MKKLTMALALLIGTGSAFAETTETTDTATETATTANATTVSNLNYFVTNKKFNVDTTVGWTSETTEIGTTETDEDGLTFGITGRYGINNDTNAGVRIGYTSTEDDSNDETSGLNDIDLLYSWRFNNTTQRQQDLNFVLSPSLGATEEKTVGSTTETNGYRGSTKIAVEWEMNSKVNTNTEWNVTAGLDYYTKEETENSAGTVTEELKSRTDFGVTAGIRHHNSEKVFIGGGVKVALPADQEDNLSGDTLSIDTLVGLNANVGYKLNKTSNITGTLGWETASAEFDDGTKTDIDLTTTNINVAYVREF